MYLRGIVAKSARMPTMWKCRRRISTHSAWPILRQPSATFGSTQALKACQRLCASYISR